MKLLYCFVLHCCAGGVQAANAFPTSEAGGWLKQARGLEGVQCVLNTSSLPDASSGCTANFVTQRATNLEGFESTHPEGDGPRMRSDDDAPYANTAWRKFRFFWCTRDHCKALRVNAWKVKVLKMAVGYFMSLCALRFVEWFRGGTMLHSDRCRQLTVAVVCLVGVCFGAPLAALSFAIVVFSLFPSSWLLFPKRKKSRSEESVGDGLDVLSGPKRAMSRFEERMNDGFSVISEKPPSVIEDPLPEPMLPEGVKPLSFKPALPEGWSDAVDPPSSQLPKRTGASQESNCMRRQESATGWSQASDAAPLIEVATEPQPSIEPLFGGELQMDVPLLTRARPTLGDEQVEPARALSSSVGEDPRTCLKEANKP